eukprot:PRCOL_00002377-RA
MSGGRGWPQVGALVRPPARARRARVRACALRAAPSRPLRDDWAAALGHIVERDFFPDLRSLAATRAWLAAARGGGEGDGEARRRLEEALGAGGEAAAETGSAGALTEGLSLDEFAARYTSEDNAAFEEIVAAESAAKRRRRAAAGLLTNAAAAAAAQPAAGRLALQLALEAAPGGAARAPLPMLPPPAPAPSSRPPKVTNAAATRMGGTRHGNTFLGGSQSTSRSTSRATSAASTPTAPSLAPLAGAAGARAPVARVGRMEVVEAGETPRAADAGGGERAQGGGARGAYELVRAPSPHPGEGGESPFMTWGRLGTTPQRVADADDVRTPRVDAGALQAAGAADLARAGDDATPSLPAFGMLPTSAREAALRRLDARTRAAKRGRGEGATSARRRARAAGGDSARSTPGTRGGRTPGTPGAGGAASARAPASPALQALAAKLHGKGCVREGRSRSRPCARARLASSGRPTAC